MTLYQFAYRFIDQINERAGEDQHPFIQWAHELAGLGRNVADEIAWCGSVLCAFCWMLRTQRPNKPARARSWLTVGEVVELKDASVGWDIVILKRGAHPQPGPDVLDAQGHVGIFIGVFGDRVRLLGGNQNNKLNLQSFPVADVLGVRRLSVRNAAVMKDGE